MSSEGLQGDASIGARAEGAVPAIKTARSGLNEFVAYYLISVEEPERHDIANCMVKIPPSCNLHV